MSDDLRAQVLAGVGASQRVALVDDPGLDADLERCRAAAAERGLPLNDAVLAEALVRVVQAQGALAEVEASDLYLAASCARGDTAALRCFEREYGGELDRAIAKSPTLRLSADEFRQLVFDRLFVHEGDATARIAKYLGKGTLKAWVRVMTSRFIIDLSRRKKNATTSDDNLAEKIGAAENTELDYLRHSYGPALDEAFERAVASLSVRQRNLLRQRYLHEVAAETLATMYSVHRSTVFLWLDQARAALLEHVRAGLAQRVPGDQLESVVGVLGSKLQLSVRRMLDSRLETETT